ncbi:MAG: SsrA-binding protein SmpB [Buchnera aphidicola (Meitanaphis microgallis)]
MVIQNRTKDLIVNIVINRKAKHRYFIQETLEAGLILFGWEVKAFKSGNVNISDSYVSFHSGEVYLIGSQFNSLYTTDVHTLRNSNRHRKVLLHKNEILSLYKKIYKHGYTAIALSFFLRNNWCKMKIAIVKGKTQYDKREIKKQSQWKREKNRIVKKIINNYS